MMIGDNSYREENQPYTFRLKVFEGPLDLLLHLIHKNELDIADIPIALITQQYLEYLKLMKILNLDIAGEYLLMASTLLHIKSKMLLPTPSEEEGEEKEEDPRAELIRRLLEYQKYKQASYDLERRPLLDRDVFVRSVPIIGEEPEMEERIEVNLFELLEAFRKILERGKADVFHEVFLERISVEEKMEEILSLLQKEKRSITFQSLFKEQDHRRILIVTLLAILELVKMKLICVFQKAPFETIRISPI